MEFGCPNWASHLTDWSILACV